MYRNNVRVALRATIASGSSSSSFGWARLALFRIGVKHPALTRGIEAPWRYPFPCARAAVALDVDRGGS
ncbi:MAG: hypothetical protein O7D86_01320 [Proteobacteria bacterium]|nr:hypothetical protein [Pseudomonadota bacterium]